MDSNAGTNELFEHNEMMLPIAMGREDLKILVSPASESSGVSSLDAEEAKVCIYSFIQVSIVFFSTLFLAFHSNDNFFG